MRKKNLVFVLVAIMGIASLPWLWKFFFSFLVFLLVVFVDVLFFVFLIVAFFYFAFEFVGSFPSQN